MFSRRAAQAIYQACPKQNFINYRLFAMSAPTAIDKVVFLGTSSGVPTKTRNTSCIGFRLSSGRCFLIDVGEGTQHQLLRSPIADLPVRTGRIDTLFLTHLHGDHCYGIFGLLATLFGLNRRTAPITIVGPVGVKELVTTVSRLTCGGDDDAENDGGCDSGSVDDERKQHDLSDSQSCADPLKFIELDGAQAVDLGPLLDGINVTAVPLTHRVPAWGYVFTEPSRPGALDARKASALGARGAMLGQLKAGNDVEVVDPATGEKSTIRAADCVGPAIAGRKVAVLQDTCSSPLAVPFCHGADLVIHECTYHDAKRLECIAHGHSTSKMAAEFCTQLSPPPKTLALTHFSSRYAVIKGAAAAADMIAAAQSSSSSDSIASAMASSSSSNASILPVSIMQDEAQEEFQRVGIADQVKIVLADDFLVLDAAKGFLPAQTSSKKL